jgi:hypothetical protein
MQTDQVGSHTHLNPHRNQVYGGAQSVYHYPAIGNSDHIVHGTSQFDDTVEYNIPSGENRPYNNAVYYFIKT